MKKIQILIAAMELFIENGFGSVSMEQVARLAEVSKATLYAHFSSKDQLFSEALGYYQQQNQIKYPKPPEGVPASAENLIQELKLYLGEAYSFYNYDAVVQLYRLVISEIKQFPDLFELFFGNSNITSNLVAYLQGYADRQQFNKDCFILACQILDLVRGATLWVKLVQNQQKQRIFANSDQLFEQVFQSVLVLVENFFKG